MLMHRPLHGQSHHGRKIQVRCREERDSVLLRSVTVHMRLSADGTSPLSPLSVYTWLEAATKLECDAYSYNYMVVLHLLGVVGILERGRGKAFGNVHAKTQNSS